MTYLNLKKLPPIRAIFQGSEIKTVLLEKPLVLSILRKLFFHLPKLLETLQFEN